MAKRKGGLQKKISSIFDGVHVPGSRKVDPLTTADPPSTDADAAHPINTDATPPTSKILSQKTPKETLRPASKQNVRPSQVLRSRRRAERVKAEAEVNEKYETKQKIFTFMIPVLVALLAYMIYDVFIAGTNQPDTTSIYKGRTEERKRAMEEAHALITWQKPDLYPENLLDPMMEEADVDIYVEGQPLRDDKSQRKGPDGKIYTKEEAYVMGLDINIDSILYSERKSSVVIDNAILREGNKIRKATIIKINKNNVEFERDGDNFTRPQRR
jgi:hypothetical protein